MPRVDDSSSRRNLDFTFKASVDSSLDAVINKLTSALDGLGKKLDTVTAASLNTARAVREQSTHMQNLGQAAGEAGDRMSKLERAFMTIGLYGGAAAVVNSIIVALRGGADATVKFDQALRDTQAITGATTVEMFQMGEVIKHVASTTKLGMDDISKGMQVIAQSGYNAADTMTVIGSAAKLAQATLSDIGTSANLLTTTLNVFNMKAIESSYVVDVLSNAVNKSKLDIDKLNVAMNYVGPVAANAGLNVSDTAASLMVLADAGLRASTMGTGLRQVLSFLLTPTKDMVALTSKYGVNLRELDPRLNSFGDVVKKMSNILTSSADAFQVFGQRGASAALILARAGIEFEGANGHMTTAFAEMKAHSEEFGSAAQMADTTMKGLGNQIANLGAKFQILGIDLAEGSLGMTIFRKLVETTSWAVSALSKLLSTPVIGDIIKDVTSLAVALGAMAGVRILIGGLVSALGLLASPLGSTVTGFIRLAAGAASMVSSFFLAKSSINVFSVLLDTLRGTYVRVAVAVDNLITGQRNLGQTFTWLSSNLKSGHLIVLAAVAAAIYALYEAYKYLNPTTEEASRRFAKQKQELKEMKDSLNTYADALIGTEGNQGTTSGQISQARILSEVASKHKELADTMNSTTKSAKEKADAIRALAEKYDKQYLDKLREELALLNKIEEKRNRTANAYAGAEDVGGNFGVAPGSGQTAKDRADSLENARARAKVIAEINYKEGMTVQQIKEISVELAKQNNLATSFVATEMINLSIQRELARINKARLTEGLTDEEKLLAQSSSLKYSFDEITAAQVLAWRDSPEKADQLKFFEFMKADLKEIDKYNQMVTDNQGKFTAEQLNMLREHYQEQMRHNGTLRLKATLIEEGHRATILALENELAAATAAAALDVVHKEQHDVKIKQLEQKLAVERYKINKELYDEMMRMSGGFMDYFGADVWNTYARRMTESAKGAASATQAMQSATRKDFEALVKREKAAIKDLESQRKDFIDQQEHQVAVDRVSEESAADSKFSRSMELMREEIRQQEKIVAIAKKNDQTRYVTEKEKLEEMVRSKTKLERDYQLFAFQLEKRRWEMTYQEAKATYDRIKLELAKSMPNNSERIRAEGAAQREVDEQHITNIENELKRTQIEEKDGEAKALRLRQLEVDLKNARTARDNNDRQYDIAASKRDYDLAHQRLMRGEITEEQYLAIRRKYRALNDQDEQKDKEDRIIDEGTVFERISLGLNRFKDKMKTNGEVIVDAAEKTADGISDAFGNAFIASIKGTESFSSAFSRMALSVVADITAMIMKQMMLNSIMGVVNAVMPSASNAIGSFLGMKQAHAGTVNNTGYQERAGFQLMHGGGLSADEYMYILQKGETVRTEQQERALQRQLSGGGGGPSVYINVTNKTGENNTVKASKPYFDGARWVSEMVIEAKNRGML